MVTQSLHYMCKACLAIDYSRHNVVDPLESVESVFWNSNEDVITLVNSGNNEDHGRVSIVVVRKRKQINLII